jgi:hypothetical protein
MKPIKDMNLSECINRLRELPDGTIEDQFDMRDLPWIFDVAEELADRIHDLTRWISVEERLPTQEDGYKSKYVTQRTVLVMEKWGDISVVTIGLAKHFTHWKRITSPEGKP